MELVQVINNRYTLNTELGSGGMGIVYRAKDRLSQRMVALKRLLIPLEFLQFMSLSTSKTTLASLAHEFEILASLRHPNIISVLDYGFDSTNSPYLVMELLENAQTIVAQGHDLPLDGKIKLILQMLDALTYLHRRGVIHRDLKPDNVLFSEQRVKLVDFGLSINRDQTAAIEGTIGYMAPEVLNEAQVSQAADLYAVGVIIYEMLTGDLPFYSHDVEEMILQILHQPPKLDILPAELQPIVGRLLSKQVEDRYTDAVNVIDDLSTIIGHEVQETISIRDSFLQAARFVGRSTELSQLLSALTAANNGHGSVWLVGGESGIGKSRLLDEFGIQALVQNVQVIRGQGIKGGGLPYQLWRDVLRRLLLAIPVTDLEARILKEIVPDIDLLLERPVLDAPSLEGTAAQQRLLQTIVDLLTRQQQPLVLLLEDLHWASESLLVIKQVTSLISNVPILIIGSYRREERPHLPEELPNVQVLLLEPLSEQQVAELSVSMLGEAGTKPQVINLLQRETEGNVFFLIEVVRALASNAGKLSNIGRMTLPPAIFAGGVLQIIRERLWRIPAEAMHLLKLASVAGRQLDLNVIKQLAGDMDIQPWLTICSNVAVLEVRSDEWRFTHDKLRETILNDLSVKERQDLNRHVAQAIEVVYPNNSTLASALVEHWHQADDLSQEAHYALIAAQRGSVISNFAESSRIVERVLMRLTEDHPLYLQLLIIAAEMNTYLGQLMEAQAYYEKSLQKARQTKNAKIEADALYGLALVMTRQNNNLVARDYVEESRVIYKHINDQAGLARSLNMLGLHAVIRGNFSQSQDYRMQSLAIFREINNQQGIGNILNNLGAVASDLRNYDEALIYHQESLQVRSQLGDRYGIGMSLSNLGMVFARRKEFEKANDYYESGLQLYREIGYQTGIAWVLLELGSLAMEQGELEQAISHYQASMVTYEAADDLDGVAWSCKNLAYTFLQQDDLNAALIHFLRSVELWGEYGDQMGVQDSYNAIAFIYALQEDWSAASKALSIAIGLAQDGFYKPLVVDSLMVGALIFRHTGDTTESRKLTEVAYAHVVDGGIITTLYFNQMLNTPASGASPDAEVVPIEEIDFKRILLNLLPRLEGLG